MIFSVIGKKISNWVLLITKFSLMVIIGNLFLSSCTAPRTIRTVQDQSIKSSKKIAQNENNQDLDPNKYFDLLEEAKEQETKVEEENLFLKPLEDQLEALKSSQSKNNKRIGSNTKRIQVLENKIEELKSKLDIFEQSLLTMNEEKPEFGEIQADSDEFVILSDEEYSKKKKKKSNPALNQVRKPNKSEKSTQPISSVLDEAPKEEVEKLNKLSFDLVTAYMDKRDYPKALKKLKEIEGRIENIEQKNEVNYLIGESHFGMRQYQNAIQYFIKVLESPNDKRQDVARLMIAESHLATGETALAKENYQALMDTNPKSKFAPKARMMLQQL